MLTSASYILPCTMVMSTGCTGLFLNPVQQLAYAIAGLLFKLSICMALTANKGRDVEQPFLMWSHRGSSRLSCSVGTA